MKTTCLILLLIFSCFMVNAAELKGGLTLGDTDYLIFSENNSIHLKTLAMDTFREYQEVLGYDYADGIFMIVTLKNILIVTEDLNTKKVPLADINPVCLVMNQPGHIKLISDEFVLVPERVPYILNTATDPFTRIEHRDIADLYISDKNTVYLFNMRDAMSTESFFCFLNNRQFTVLRKRSGNAVMSSFQDYQSLTDLSEDGNEITAVFDNRWKVVFSVEKRTEKEKTKLESSDSLEKTFYLKDMSSPVTVVIQPSSTSVFSILSDWKKGESSADISLTLSGETLLNREITFSMKNMEDFSGEMTSSGNYILIYMPEKTHIIRRTGNSYKLSSFDTNTPIAVMKNKCFVQTNGIITELDSQCPDILVH